MPVTTSRRPLVLLGGVMTALLVAACGSGPTGAAPSSASTSSTTTIARPATTSSSATRTPGALADEWDAEIAAAKKADVAAPCAPVQARTPTCAGWLTSQVEAVSSLYTSLRTARDSGRYTKTIAATEKVFDASGAYAKMGCGAGNGTVDDCWTQAFAISTSVLTVGLALRADDLTL
ncbi:hypothetical protein [Umezawaea sp. Da 62-37]|uniref:hypothetical protein n=1 Tax=Umezawaea sp. Da 62-37 TaxID=3075927 RepID=UPI0028F6CF25|nr:hypothetical protein [Umezawaea sp. Da 62-37]WNV90634.1 hypothetical protein RM788_20825 [Umezawaea sp. Da 62-37]